MTTKQPPRKKRTSAAKRQPRRAGNWKIVSANGIKKLELRHRLRMTRKPFCRLLDVSERTLADVEAEKRTADKFKRNYTKIRRLVEALSEIIDTDYLGEWLETPNEAFDGLKPIEVVERGEEDRLWEMYFRLSSGMPG